MSSNRLSKLRRHGVSNLNADVNFLPLKYKIVWKALKPRGLAMCDGSIGLWVQVPPLLRLVELAAYGDRWTVPPKSSEEIGSAFRFSFPTFGH